MTASWSRSATVWSREGPGRGSSALSGGQFAAGTPGRRDNRTRGPHRAGSEPRFGPPLVANGDAIVLDTRVSVSRLAAPTAVRALFADAEVALAQAKSLGRRARRDLRSGVPAPRGASDRAAERPRARGLRRRVAARLPTDRRARRPTAIVGYEALVRWQHPSRGLLAPHDFLGIAQRTGAGAAIDDWVLTRGVPPGGPWAPRPVPTEHHLRQRRARAVRDRRLRRTGRQARSRRPASTPARLVIEITEWSVLARRRPRAPTRSPH